MHTQCMIGFSLSHYNVTDDLHYQENGRLKITYPYWQKASPSPLPRPHLLLITTRTSSCMIVSTVQLLCQSASLMSK